MRGATTAAALLFLPSLLLLLLRAAEAGNGSCARRCGRLTVQYPFGFSPGCKIQLGCDDSADDGAAWVGATRGLGLVVRNVTARALVVELLPVCDRRLNASLDVLFSGSYAPSTRNALIVSSCDRAAQASRTTTNCGIPPGNYLGSSSHCSGVSADSIRCVPPPPPKNASMQHNFLNRTEMLDLGSECALVTAVSYSPSPEPAFTLGVLDLEWWMLGSCRCSNNANCTTLTTPTKQQAFRCDCLPGFEGNGFADGGGCRRGHAPLLFTSALKVFAAVSAGVFLPAFTCFWIYLGLQKRKLIKTKQRFFEENGGVLLQQQMRSYGSAGAGSSGFKLFSEEELKKATDNFAADRVLGRGGHGIVYRGVLEDKSVVAIKKSKVTEAPQTKEFAKELFILSQINHRNVVKLLGCCLEVEVPMLVYEFVPKGTLYHYIHDKKEDLDADITFDTRLRIAAESAEALAYMHSSASPPIIHGDVKTANILLDDKLTAKVSDFGASRLAPTDEVEITTLVQGTCGYLDPEYLMTCQLTDKSDVYSFGVVLLELLTRKKALYFEGPDEDRSLVACFTTVAKAGRHGELLDNQVRSEVRAEVLDEITHLVLQCVSMTGEERPTMKAVAERLEVLRRYQQHPWARSEGPSGAAAGLLGNEQQNSHPYKFDSYYYLGLF